MGAVFYYLTLQTYFNLNKIVDNTSQYVIIQFQLANCSLRRNALGVYWIRHLS